MTRFSKAAYAVLAAVLAVLLLSSGPALAAGKPRIDDTRVERAPIGKKGGLMNPVVWCPSGAEPRVVTVVNGITDDFHAVWRYRGSLPGLYFPRVEVGRYELSTKAWCGGKRSRRIEVVTVREKTARTTISWDEFRRIKRGMTSTKVRKIIGYSGYGSRYGAWMIRTYDMMPFWRYSSVEFRHGRVLHKYWNTAHD